MSKRSHLIGLLLLSVGLSGCVVGAPPGFSDGDLWSVPLVAPLENDLLLVPVSLNGEGPFLFMVDPDSPESSVEASLQASLDLYARRSGQRQTEDDHLTHIIIAEVKKMSIGDLNIRNMRVRVHDDGTYWSGDRRVRGVLGRDVIADSLAFKFDRDQGMMYIGTQGHMKPPEDARTLHFTQSYSRHKRHLASIEINRKHKVTMHLDLGARTSMIWSKLMKKYKMPNVPLQAVVVDEYGTRSTLQGGTIAGIVRANETETNALMMLPYSDKRMDEDDLDGILGQNFWSKYNITVNWHQKKFWLQTRNPDLTANATARIQRWGDQLVACETLACLRPTLKGRPEPTPAPVPVPSSEEVQVSEEDRSAPPATPPVEGATAKPAPVAMTTPQEAPAPMPVAVPANFSLHIERDAPGTEFAYDALIGAVDENGSLLDLPIFLASFAAGVPSLEMQNLSEEYGQAASFVVLDINPVGTRGCEGSQCIFQRKRP